MSSTAPSRHRAFSASSAAFALAIALAAPRTTLAAVHSSVFDDVKVWYKGSAGNAVGTADSGGGDSQPKNKMKSIPHMADPSSSMHGARIFWWGWRLQYKNQKVDCPYAGVTLDSAPCMVVPSYAAKNGDAVVTINGETTTQPYWTSRRFGNYWFDNWMSDWTSGTVCSNWTCVLRFRSDQVNQASGNCNKVIDIGSLWDGTAGKATGVSFMLNTPVSLADYACPRTFVSTTQMNYTDIKIKSGRWVDCALAVDGQTLSIWLCWNDGTDETPTNKLAKITETYPTTKGLPTISAGCRVNLASQKEAYSATFTNGVYNADMANKAFEGAFHQIAFWDRTLSDDEIREAMAGGTGRPNLVQVGMEGNGIEEFATSSQTASVSNTGAWENLNPALSAENPTATISFTCPALWASQSQWLRVCGASGSGKVSAAINGTPVGECAVAANGVGRIFVPTNVIVSGANTLILTRTAGSPVIDAVTLGGSWRFGESISSFGYQSDVANNPDRFTFNPACGYDKIHNRGMNSTSAPRETYFDFFVPEDLVGRFRGVFTTRTQNTGGSSMPYTFHANGTQIGGYTLKGGVETEVKIPETAIVAGWNRLYWKTTSGGYWANIDWNKFTLIPAPVPFVVVVR